jgi:nicotinate-nucleotide adenylyltransferase
MAILRALHAKQSPNAVKGLQLTKIAIFPGAFDPVHEGHLDFVRAAIDHCHLDKVYFLPEPRPRHKQGVKALEHRLEMVQRAIAREPKMGVIALHQARSNSLDTLPQLLTRFGSADVFLLSGQRILRHLPYWLPIDSEMRVSRIIVGIHGSPEGLKEQFTLLKHTSGLRLGMESFQAPRLTQHSLGIRKSLRKGEMPEIIPAAVRYIRAQGLYAATSAE